MVNENRENAGYLGFFARDFSKLSFYLIIGFKKPIVGYIAGRKAPKEKRMGHAGAIVMGNYGSAESKIAMFAKANIPVAKRPGEIAILLSGKM